MLCVVVNRIARRGGFRRFYSLDRRAEIDLRRLISPCSDRSAKIVDSTLEDHLSEPVPTARTHGSASAVTLIDLRDSMTNVTLQVFQRDSRGVTHFPWMKTDTEHDY